MFIKNCENSSRENLKESNDLQVNHVLWCLNICYLSNKIHIRYKVYKRNSFFLT